MFTYAPASSVAGNIVGMKWVVVFGTLGYAPYSAALYCNSVWGTQWFLMFGAVTCGFSVYLSLPLSVLVSQRIRVLISAGGCFMARRRDHSCGIPRDVPSR